MVVCEGCSGAVQTLNFTVNRVIRAMGEGADQAGRLPSTNKYPSANPTHSNKPPCVTTWKCLPFKSLRQQVYRECHTSRLIQESVQ
jgi:hypothetical protein